MNVKIPLVKAYLSWVNDFLTIERFAEYYGYSIDDANQIISLGKKYHEENVEFHKLFGVSLYVVD